MDRTMVAAFIFAAIAVGVIAQGWVSWLDHQRRSKALDVIKAALEAGKEPPKELYAQLESSSGMGEMGLSKRPWTEAVIFGAMGIAFWIVYAMNAGEDARDKYLLVAAIMSATSLGCFALAFFRSQKPNDDGR